MRLLHITSIAVSALVLFGCSDESAKATQDDQNPCEESCPQSPSCQDDSTLKKCEINSETGCAEWIESSCPRNTTCHKGECVSDAEQPECEKKCAEKTSCVNDTTLKTCQINKKTGCVEWVESTCQEGTSCSKGACQSAPEECERECPKEATCINESTLKTCQLNEETGCVEWVESTCPENTSCLENECKPTPEACEKECPKDAECVNESTLKTCQLNEETGCAQWVESICPAGTSCSENACTPEECEKECPEDAVCVNESTLKSCQFNEETGCAQWVESICPEKTSCNNGLCEPVQTCTDACSKPKCANEHAYQTCEKNKDGCMELSEPIACKENQICQDGACIHDDNIYLKNLKPIMQPLFDNKQMLEETAMFINVGDTAQMLYNVDNVVKLTSYDGSKLYTGGVDYDVVNGKLKTLNTAIPHITDAKYYNVAETMLVTEHNGQHVYTYWGEGTTMTQWQVKVTYNHSDTWNGFKQPSYNATFAKFIQKLKNKENVKILFYGDSITFGANASYVAGGGSQHSYSMLFTEALADLYGYKVEYQASGLPNTFTNMPPTYNPTNAPTITYINNAVGGWTMAKGQDQFEKYITPYAKDCDLFILAFGMNDGGTDLTALNQMAVNMMTRIQQVSPNVSEVVMSTMLPNPKALNGWYANQIHQEGTFANGVIKTMQAKNVPIALCQMTSMSKSILERKEFKDYTGNNINHPNDFFSRVYAQTLLQTVIGYENMK